MAIFASVSLSDLGVFEEMKRFLSYGVVVGYTLDTVRKHVPFGAMVGCISVLYGCSVGSWTVL